MNLLGQNLSFLEIAGTITGLVAVWLTVKQNRWCFPLGIISCLLYAWVFFSPGIRFYSDAILQLIYIVLLVYGWIHWRQRKEDVPVTRSGPSLLKKSFLITLSGTVVIGFVFHTCTDASLPYIDAFTTSLSLVAQWMVAKKKIENWPMWMVANVIYIGMYIHKDLNVTAVYYLILLILAVAGFRNWKNSLT